MKREITPHKGGRTETVIARITPDDKELLSRLADEHGMTMSDIVSSTIRAFELAFNPVERHFLAHGVKAYEREELPHDSSYTFVVFNDDSKIERWCDAEANVKITNTNGWHDDDLEDFFEGQVFDQLLREIG